MVMTSYMYHLMFEKVKDSECMYLLNEIRAPKQKTKDNHRSMVDRHDTILNDERKYNYV